MSQEDAKAADVEAIRSHVKRCTIVATSLMVVISAVVYQVIPVSRLAALDTVMSRLVFTLQWNALTVAVIFVMIAVIGQVRFYTNQPNPLAPVQSVDREQLEVHVRVLQNTVEQFVVSFVAQVATSTWLSASQMMTIPIVVVLFVVGRLVYWRGYLNPAYNRTGRAAGLPLTMFPTMAMLVFTIYKLVITTVGIV